MNQPTNVQKKPSTSGTAQSRSAKKLQLKDIVLIVALGSVFGFLYWVLVQAWNVVSVLLGPFGDLTQHVLFGGWLIVAPIAIAIIRRPGVGIVAEIIAALIEVLFLGSPAGPLLLLAAFLQGFGSELPFALTRYKKFSWGIYALSGFFGGVIVFFYSAAQGGWYGQDILFLRLAIQAISGILFGGLLAKVVVDALVRTSVLNNFAIITENQKHLFAQTTGLSDESEELVTASLETGASKSIANTMSVEGSSKGQA